MGEEAFAQSETPVDGGTLRFGCQIQELTDPMLSSWIEASNLYRNCLEFLTYVDANNITHPYLAKSWTPSADLTVWDFDLDERAKWSNGDAFTPEDVVFNIERWIAPDSQSSNKTAFAAVQKVEKTGDHSVRITLSRPVSSLPEQLYSYTCPMLHRNFVSRWGQLAGQSDRHRSFQPRELRSRPAGCVRQARRLLGHARPSRRDPVHRPRH